MALKDDPYALYKQYGGGVDVGPTSQQLKCLRGEHESDEDIHIQTNRQGGGPPRVDVIAMLHELTLEDAVQVCKYCRCLYVEKA